MKKWLHVKGATNALCFKLIATIICPFSRQFYAVVVFIEILSCRIRSDVICRKVKRFRASCTFCNKSPNADM